MSSTTVDSGLSKTTLASSAGLTRGARLRRALLPYLLILPTFLFIATFTLWPMVSSAVNSTMKPGITVKIPPKFVGLNNFRDLFDSTTVSYTHLTLPTNREV